MMQQLPTSSGGGTAATALSPTLTSTTAPGKIFNSRSELQEHYKSDWHRYNLKRREAGLPMLNESDFQLRLEAALALRKEREGRDERSGVDHRKDKSKKVKDKNNKQQGKKSNRRKPMFAKREEENNRENNTEEENNEEIVDGDMMDDDNEDGDEAEDTSEIMDEEPPEINPSQCLFDNHTSSTPQSNLSYMQSTYSFFLPDSEYCIDLEGFLGYCNEKIRLGNICLYCQRTFTSTEGVLRHMKDKRHCKILYERGVDQEEFDVFFDFSKFNRQFMGEDAKKEGDKVGEEAMEADDMGRQWEDVDEDDNSEWEDASMKDGSSNIEEEEDDLYEAYQSEIATQGYDITPLGELIFPDGRIVGHRGLARYYKQRFAPDRMERAAVRHAREAAGDRLYGGRVVNLHRLNNGGGEGNNDGTAGEGGNDMSSSTALATMGRMAGSIPTGRSGKGILVSGEGKGGFTSLSLYRYRAAVKKQRREDARGQRLQHRSKMNLNKMDKKGNTRATGVVTALNPR